MKLHAVQRQLFWNHLYISLELNWPLTYHMNTYLPSQLDWKPEAYLELILTCTIKLCWENSKQLKAVNYFRKNTSSQMFDWVLTMSMKVMRPSTHKVSNVCVLFLLFYFCIGVARNFSPKYPFHCVKSVQIWSYFWSVFTCIRTEYEDLRSTSPYSVRIQENTDQK